MVKKVSQGNIRAISSLKGPPYAHRPNLQHHTQTGQKGTPAYLGVIKIRRSQKAHYVPASSLELRPLFHRQGICPLGSIAR